MFCARILEVLHSNNIRKCHGQKEKKRKKEVLSAPITEATRIVYLNWFAWIVWIISVNE